MQKISNFGKPGAIFIYEEKHFCLQKNIETLS